MKEAFRKLRNNAYVVFVSKTIFYFLILIALVYLYNYSGMSQSNFIYNEF